MQITKSLKSRILYGILSIVFIILVAIGVSISISKIKFAKEKGQEYAQLLAEKNAINIGGIINKYVSFMDASSEGLSNIAGTNDSLLTTYCSAQLSKLLKTNKHINSGWLLIKTDMLDQGMSSGEQWSLLSLDAGEENTAFRLKPSGETSELQTLIGEPNSTFVSDLINSGTNGIIAIASPIFKGSNKIAYIGIDLSTNSLKEEILIAKIIKGGSIGVLTKSGIYASHTNKELEGTTYNESDVNTGTENNIADKISKGLPFNLTTETNNETILSFFAPIKIGSNNASWAIEIDLPLKSLLATSRKNITAGILITLVGLLIIGIVLYLITNSILKPIVQATNALDLLTKGNLKDIKKIDKKRHDELSELTESLNHVVNGLRKTENFALEIRDGNLDNSYATLGDDDNLGNALIEMRDSLKHSKLEEEKRKLEDEQMAWATNGIAKFSEILRKDNDNLKNLGYNIMSNLVNYLDVNQGALFVLNEEEESESDPFFELVTAIAFGRDKYMEKEIHVGEGLVGRCAFEKKTIYLTDVPENYHSIKSGLGDAAPKCVLIVPCILNDDVYGIIEIAAFSELKPHEIEFVEKLGESIASTLSSVRVNIKTATLLAASKNQSEELAAQEEELRQNLEEMETTQEDLKRQMESNKEMQVALSQQSALLDALLSSLPDYIYFKDKDSKFLKISDSMTHLFGVNSADDVIGKSDFDYHTPENARKYYDEEQLIIQNKQGFADRMQHEKTAEGEDLWMTVSKLPIINAEGEAIGTFGISKNVTDLKNIEIEASKQSALLNSLLNSLPDFIYFKDEESKFIKISESMTHLFGVSSPHDVVGKSDFDYHTPENAEKYFNEEQRMIKNRQGFTDRLQEEITEDGSHIWTSVSKLPLIDAEGDCIGTFGISKNVTDLKNLEIDISAQKAELTGVFEAINKAALTVEYDSKGVVTDANQGMLDLLKLELKNYIGTNNKDEITDMTAAEHKSFWKRLMNGEAQSIKNTIKVGNKKYNLFEAYSPIIKDDKKIVKVLRLAFDIS